MRCSAPASAASRPPERRGRAPRLGDEPGEFRLREQALRRYDLARLEARDLDGQARLVGLAQREGAGRNIERSEAEKGASVGLHALDREQQIGAARLQQ